MLNKNEVRKAICLQSPVRPPLCEILWHNQETLDYYGDDFRRLLIDYPNDIIAVHIGIPYYESNKRDDPNYRWAYHGWEKPSVAAMDNCPIIKDWDIDLKRFLDDMPNPHRKDAFDEVTQAVTESPDRYILVNWGHYFHQRLCYLRGTENLLYDFYDNAKHLQLLMDSLLEFYSVWAERTAQSGAGGVWAGDDLGMQSGLFMRPETFRTLYKPFYKRLGEILHRNGLDFWLHSCGDIYEVLGDLIECGVDVLHPIQAGCMDAAKTVKNYGAHITFWVGMDVQQLIPFASIPEIKKQIEAHAKIFYNSKGGVIYGAGNSILPGTPIINIETYAHILTNCCSNFSN